MNGAASLTLTLNDRDEALHLFGNRDQYLRAIRDALAVRIIARGDEVHIDGSAAQVEQAERVFAQLRMLLQKQGGLTPENVRTVIAVVTKGDAPAAKAVVGAVGRTVRPRTDGQGRYVHAMQQNDVVFAIGPAGTGKCVAEDTLVLTGGGMTPISVIAAGAPPHDYRAHAVLVQGLEGPA